MASSTDTPSADTAEAASAPRLRTGGRVFRGLMAAGAATWYTYAALIDPDGMPGWTVCPTKLLTDVPCPSCGFGRGFILISHGHLVEALQINVWAPIAFMAAAPVAVLLAVEAIVGRDWVDRFFRGRKQAVYIGVAVMVVVRYAVLLAWG